MFQTSVCLITGCSHTRIGVFPPGGPVTTYIGCGSKEFSRNGPRVPPDQRMPRSLRPVGPKGPLRTRCPSVGTPGQRGTNPGSGSPTTTGLVGDIGLTVAVVTQLVAFVGRLKLARSSPHLAHGIVLIQKSTPPNSLAIRSQPSPLCSLGCSD